MDYKLFFDPVDEELYADIPSSSSFCKSIHINQGKMPSLKGMQIAIIGLTEARGNTHLAAADTAANEIRKKLYRLKKGSGTYKIVDMGNMRNGPDLEESYGRLREVCFHLIENNTLPVIIGGSHDMDLGLFRAYENMEKLITFLTVDAFLDIEDEGKSQASDRHIHKIILHEPNYLFNFSLLGFQSYLIPQNAVEVLEKLYFEAYRLGQIRDNMQEIEPVIRQADVMSFDFNALKNSDFPGATQPQPFGLTGEEACQICWYAGMNEKLSAVGFFEYDPANDDENFKSAAVAATMIWYFIEGYHHRKLEQDFKSNDYIKYTVPMKSEPASISFFKSKFSEKWWMEVPYPEKESTYQRNAVVPCSYKDYETALSGEIPDRWINMYARLL